MLALLATAGYGWQLAAIDDYHGAAGR